MFRFDPSLTPQYKSLPILNTLLEDTAHCDEAPVSFSVLCCLSYVTSVEVAYVDHCNWC